MDVLFNDVGLRMDSRDSGISQNFGQNQLVRTPNDSLPLLESAASNLQIPGMERLDTVHHVGAERRNQKELSGERVETLLVAEELRAELENDVIKVGLAGEMEDKTVIFVGDV